MKLSTSECYLFYKLHPALMCYVNYRLKTLPDQPGDPTKFYALEAEKRVKVRDALHAQPELIDQFVDANPFGFDPEELKIVGSWRHALAGSFYVFRYLKNYAVFDPQLLYEGWQDEMPPVDSLQTRVSAIIPEDGRQFHFEYEYDFGDGWDHEVLFEGCLRAEKGTRYPLCVEGERACPPDDVGGVGGYQEYLETLSDPDHEEWDETSDWRGPYRPEHFDADAATKKMRRGLPNWRTEKWI